MTVCRTKKEWFCFPEGKKPFLFYHPSHQAAQKQIHNLNQKKSRNKPCGQVVDKLVPGDERLNEKVVKRQIPSDGKSGL